MKLKILLFCMVASLTAAAVTYTFVGDVNNDGEVNIADVTSLVNIVLSEDASSNAMADVNEDDEVSVADITSLVNLVLDSEAPRKVTLDDSDLTEAADVVEDDEDAPAYGDYIENASFTSTVTITYDGNSAAVSGRPTGVSITTSGAHVTVISAIKNVKYVLTGSSSDGSFKIYSEKKFCLTLNGLDLTNPSGAAINNQCGKTLYLVLPEGTDNHLADGETYTEVELEDQKAAFFSEGQIIFSGKGRLNVDAVGKSGITSDDYIRFRPGTHININSSANHGVKANDGIFIDGGVLNIRVTANGAKGINCGGVMEVNGGRTTVITTGAPVIESTELGNDTTSCAALKADTLLTITGGTLCLKSSGDGGKGINCNNNIVMTDGNVTIVAQGVKDLAAPKGVKCDGTLSVTSGAFYTYSSKSKPLDVAGGVTVSDGYRAYTETERSVNIEF